MLSITLLNAFMLSNIVSDDLSGTAALQQKPYLENSALGFRTLGFATIDDVDIVALVEPDSVPSVHFVIQGIHRYIVQVATVIDSPDIDAGVKLHLYYPVPRTEIGPVVAADELTQDDVALEQRPYLVLAKKRSIEIKFEEVLGPASEFTVTAHNTNVQNAIAVNFFEADLVKWSDKEDRREWLVHTIARSLPHMPDVGLRRACALLSGLGWAPEPRVRLGNRPDYTAQKYALYKATIEARAQLPASRSAKAWLYVTNAIAGLEQRDRFDQKSYPGKDELIEALFSVVQNNEALDEVDYKRFTTHGRSRGTATDRMALAIASHPDYERLRARAFSVISKLESRADRLSYFQISIDLKASTRHSAYEHLYRWLSITTPAIEVTRDSSNRVDVIVNEQAVRAAIRSSLGG